MTRNAAINLAIKAVKGYMQEHFGNGSKYHPDEKAKYDRYIQAIEILESLKEEKHE